MAAIWSMRTIRAHQSSGSDRMYDSANADTGTVVCRSSKSASKLKVLKSGDAGEERSGGRGGEGRGRGGVGRVRDKEGGGIHS